jgi:tripartite-type tricarboxylate transporter receptor subunit TctC
MTQTKRLFLSRSSLGILALAWLPLTAVAQPEAPWPTKAVRVIVGFASGSSPDVLARLLAEPLSRSLGQPVIVENRPGAGGNIGADVIAKADDGHTIGIVGNGPLTSSRFLYSKLPYDPIKDLTPIALIGAAPLIWVVPKSAVTGTVEDYLKQSRVSGDKLNYGSVGTGSGGHLAMELIKEQLALNPLHVPFNGGPPILNAMLGGQIQMTLLPVSTVMPFVRADKLAAVAVTTARRSPLAPDLPSMQEIGAKAINIEVWNAVMAPAKMPTAHRARLSSEVGKILDSREMRVKLILLGWKAEDNSPGALALRIKSDTATYGELITKKGIKLE